MDPLELLKARLGFLNPPDAVQKRLELLIDATKKMLMDEKGIRVDLTNPLLVNFIVEYSAWMYESKGEKGSMPQHLRFALHNLYIHNRGDAGV